MSTAKIYIFNTISSYSIVVLKMIVTIIFIPILLNSYGQEEFGLYLLIFGLSSTIGFIDLGAGKSILKYSAEYKADGDKMTFQEALSATTLLNLISACLVVLAILGLSHFSVSLFNISAEHASLTKDLFIVSAINALVVFLDFIPANVLSGFSYFKKRNKLQLIPIFLNAGLLLLIQFTNSISLLTYCYLSTGINLLFLIGDLILMFSVQEMKGITLNFQISRNIFSNQYTRFSMILFAISTVGFMGIQADKFLLASILNVSAVTIYTIITRPYFLIKSLTANSFGAIQPLLIKTHKIDLQKFSRIVENFTRLSFMLGLSFVLLLSIFFEQFLTLWLSTTRYNKYAIWGIFAFINIIIPMLYGAVSSTLLLSTGAMYLLKFNSIAIVLNFIISIILTYLIGFPGVIIGTTIQFVIEFFVINKASIKFLNFPLRRIFSKPFVLFICLLISFGMILRITLVGFFPLFPLQFLCLFLITAAFFGLLNYIFIAKNGQAYLFSKSYWKNL